ncbi:MAG: amidohydrolase family protein [Planctomycetota bacterium]
MNPEVQNLTVGAALAVALTLAGAPDAAAQNLSAARNPGATAYGAVPLGPHAEVRGGGLFAVAREDAPQAGEVGGAPLVLRASKALLCSAEGDQVANRVDLLVDQGRIAAIGRQGELELPQGAVIRDCGDQWLMPGLVDLHCHIAGKSLFVTNDLNDAVLLTNPGLRASSAVEPYNDSLQMGVAGGVTSVLYIPGSATNIGGQGVLLKTGFDRYEDMEIRNPGSMKLAQAGNPERWAIGVGRSFMNWNTRNTVARGLAYAAAWAEGAWSDGHAVDSSPIPNPQWDVFRSLAAGETQISAHTQIFQVVLATITMIRRDFGLDVYIDHGTIGGWKAGGLAQEYGVPAIVGPRAVDTTSTGFQRITAAQEDGIRGVAAGYQRMGHTNVGFNTDSPVIPQEELSLQGALAARYGFKDDSLQVVRGLTIVPAMASGIDHLVGSLEVGKHADILVLTGHPADPRTSIESVFIEGRRVYDPARDGRLW